MKLPRPDSSQAVWLMHSTGLVSTRRSSKKSSTSAKHHKSEKL